MENVLLVVVLMALLIRWAILARRYAEMEGRIDMLVRGRIEPREFTNLIRRVSLLERSAAQIEPPVEELPEMPEPEPPQPDPLIAPPREPEPVPVVEPDSPPPVREPEPEPQSARPSRSSAEWEALVGGNWLYNSYTYTSGP